VLLKNVNGIIAAVKGPQTLIQSVGVGILIENSSYITLDGGGVNPSGAGIAAAMSARSTRTLAVVLTWKTATIS
jgi:hypothetical protein